MFISFIIPIFNDEKYLRECLDSCLAQDIPYSDYEIICVDDGSTDNTPNILREYEKNHSNIRLFFQKHGAAGGRDVGLEIAQGDYVWFVDHDDFIESNILCALKKRTQKTNCERLVFPYYSFEENLTTEEKKQRAQGELPIVSKSKYPPNLTAWSCIFNRSFLINNNIWPRTRQVPRHGPVFGGDEFFAHECNDAISNEEEWMERPLYFHRVYLGSETAKAGKVFINKKVELYYNRALASLEKASQWRDCFENECRLNGEATEATTVKMMRWLRESRVILSGLPSSYWREGNKQLKSRGFTPFRRPKEYTYTCRAHLKNSADTGDSCLKRAAYYYAYGKPGASLYRLLNIRVRLSRVIQSSETMSALKRRILKRTV